MDRSGRIRSVVGLAALLVLVSAGCDWVQPGYDAGRTSNNPSEPALTSSTVTSLTSPFTFARAGVTYGRPVVRGASLFVSGRAASGASVEAIDAKTGAPIWSKPLVPESTSSPVTVVTDAVAGPDQVFAATYQEGSKTTTVYALSSSNGAVRWRVTMPATQQVQGPLALAHGRVILTLFEPGTVFSPWGTAVAKALDAGTGATAWTWVSGGPPGGSSGSGIWGAVVTSGGLVAVAYPATPRPGRPEGDPTTALLSETDGTAQGSNLTQTTVLMSAGDVLYALQYPQDLTSSVAAAIDARSRANKWAVPGGLPRAVGSGVVVTHGGPTASTTLTALDARTGATRWSTPAVTGEQHSAPVIAGNLVYSVVKGSGRRLRIQALADGSIVHSLAIPTGTGPPVDPVVANGVVYVVVDGAVTAYAPRQSG